MSSVMSEFKQWQADLRAYAATLPYGSHESQDGFTPGRAFDEGSLNDPLWRIVTIMFNQV